MQETTAVDLGGIVQGAGRNLGTMTAVSAGSVLGNLIVGDIQQVQIYVLSQEARAAGMGAFLKEDAVPYKCLSAYTAQDQKVFCGRDEQIDQVVGRIRRQQLLVIHGKANVGKTSLLAAGVIPRLLVEDGVMVVGVPDYLHPVECIYEALQKNAQHVRITLPQRMTLPAIVQSVTDSLNGCLVLVFDHLERLFEPVLSDEQRAALIDGLAQACNRVDPRCLRMVFVIREEAVGNLLVLQDRLPDLLTLSCELRPLDRDHARAAIMEPLHALNDPIEIDKKVLEGHLLPDLLDLNHVSSGVEPAQLQIVCHWLFERTRLLNRRHLDIELYEKENGAEGIMDGHVDRTLQTQLAGEKGLAEQILLAMAAPGMDRWVAPDKLPTDGASARQVYDVLEKLVKAELLAPRSGEGKRLYAFAYDGLGEKVRLLAGEEGKRRLEAQDELDRAWSTWTLRDTLATPGQVRFLDRYAAAPNLPADSRPDYAFMKKLLLLSSAVACNAPVSNLLTWLKVENDCALIDQLETDGTPGKVESASASVGPPQDGCAKENALSKTRRLLSLDDAELPKIPAAHKGYSVIAWCAVRHPDATRRHTAALALAAADREEVLNWLEQALNAGLRGWARVKMANELRAVLVDADPEIEKDRAALRWSINAWTWCAGAWQRAIRDLDRLAALSAGAGLGAGLALGLWRAAAFFPAHSPGTEFAMGLFGGSILGAGLGFGMALAGCLAVPRSAQASPEAPELAPPALAAGMGAVGFGIAHIVISLLIAFFVNPAPAMVGFPVGLALAAALWRQPQAGWHLGWRGWSWRLAVAALPLLLIQWVNLQLPRWLPRSLPPDWTWIGTLSKSTWMVFSRDVDAFRRVYSYLDVPGWQALMKAYPRWDTYASVLDTAVVGIVLTLGITAGLIVANRQLKRWHDLRSRVGD